MRTYLYVLWAVEDEIVKLGISNNQKKRVEAHSGNSSNPISFMVFKTYLFSSRDDAKQIETKTKTNLTEQGFQYRKAELFKCPPNLVTSTIEKLCDDAQLSAIRNPPASASDALEKLDGFPCMPEHGFEVMSTEQRQLYWKGVRDTLHCLAYFDGLSIAAKDLRSISAGLTTAHLSEHELWGHLIDYYRNNGPAERRGATRSASEEIRIDRRCAFVDWQQIEYDDED